MFEGEPAAIFAHAERLRRLASRTGHAREEVAALHVGDRSLAVEAVRAARLRLAARLRALAEHQAAVAAVLERFAEVLERAQARAAEAESDRSRALAALEDAEREIAANRAEALWTLPGSPEWHEVEHRAELAAARRAAAAERLAAADEARLAAERLRDDAAEAAISSLLAVEAPPGIDGPRDPRPGRSPWALLRTISRDVEAGIAEAAGLLHELLLRSGALAIGARLVGAAAHPLEASALAVLGTIVSAWLLARITSDIGSPAPRVERLPRRAVSTPRTASAALVEAAEVDRLGGDDRSVVKITEVLGEDGVVRWRVALPSTQDWSLGAGDAGATNDLDANLALLLVPEARTQSERGVLAAMAQAGVGPEDPVLLVGFSQGGILAAHLAAHRDAYAWRSVIAAGSPIDAAPIPERVSVVSVEHDGDPVTRIDALLGARPRTGSSWTRFRDASAASAEGLGGIHSVAEYDATLRRHAVELARRRPELEAFYAGRVGSRSGVFAWRE